MFIGAINSLLPLIKEGKLRALASAGDKRVASLPEVPTFAEAGLSGVQDRLRRWSCCTRRHTACHC